MEKPLKDYDVNVAYWYHLRRKDIGLRAKKFDEEANGDNRSLVGKHA
jgi:hypothetical protein